MILARSGAAAWSVGHEGVVRALLADRRVEVDAQDAHGQTALWWACHEGLTDMARLLLLEGGAGFMISPTGSYVMPLWAEYGKRKDCATLLKWYEHTLWRYYVLAKARALADHWEAIRAAEAVGAKTKGGAMRARKQAAPAYLRGRVVRGQALPRLKMVLQPKAPRHSLDDGGVDDVMPWWVARSRPGLTDREWEEEGLAVSVFVVRRLTQDLFVELMHGLRQHHH